jgi:hypothetical protein
MVQFKRTTFAQREPFYRDLVSLLAPGFLAHKVGVGFATLSLRDLSHNDFFLLRHRIPMDASEKEWQRWVVATCVWMLDGQILLGHPNAAPLIYPAICKLPDQTMDILFHVVLGLAKRRDDALDALDVYCLEDSSRSLWRQVGGATLPRDNFSGVPGAELLGANIVQRIWTVYNEFEDQRTQDLTEWAMSKFLVSPHAPKGVKSLDAKDKQKHESLEAERQQKMDRFFYAQLGLVSPDGKPIQTYDRIHHASTPDELEEEMRRWVAGDMDNHDKIVAEYKAKVVAKREAEKQERLERLQEARRQAAEVGEDAEAMSLIAYAPEQVKALLERKRGNTPAGVQFIAEGKQDYVYEKYLSGDIDKGRLRVVGGKVRAVEVDPGALNKQLAGRRVVTTQQEDGE